MGNRALCLDSSNLVILLPRWELELSFVLACSRPVQKCDSMPCHYVGGDWPRIPNRNGITCFDGNVGLAGIGAQGKRPDRLEHIEQHIPLVHQPAKLKAVRHPDRHSWHSMSREATHEVLGIFAESGVPQIVEECFARLKAVASADRCRVVHRWKLRQLLKVSAAAFNLVRMRRLAPIAGILAGRHAAADAPDPVNRLRGRDKTTANTLRNTGFPRFFGSQFVYTYWPFAASTMDGASNLLSAVVSTASAVGSTFEERGSVS